MKYTIQLHVINYYLTLVGFKVYV